MTLQKCKVMSVKQDLSASVLSSSFFFCGGKIFMNTFKARFLSIFLLAALLAALPNSHARAYSVVFVDCDAAGENDGSSWKNAYSDLQSALGMATEGSEIWVAACVYKPTTGSDRSASFRLKNGVALYGGFAGNEDSLEQRDLVKNVTILSGDIGVTGEAHDNSYHVIVSAETDATTILDGFTVTDGNADSDALTMDLLGGGMYNLGSPTLRNVTFSNNSAYEGGGMYNSFSGPTLSDVIFSKNSSSYAGGGMYNSSSSPT